MVGGKMDGSRHSIGWLISEEVPRDTQKRGMHTRWWASMHQVPPFLVGHVQKIIRGVIAIPGLIFCIGGKVVNLY